MTQKRAKTSGSSSRQPRDTKKFQQTINLLLNSISEHRNGSLFLNPIKRSDAPDYFDIVKRPMDLKTIKQRIRDGTISDLVEFERDVYLTFANAMMYNAPSSEIYKMAAEVRDAFILKRRDC